MIAMLCFDAAVAELNRELNGTFVMTSVISGAHSFGDEIKKRPGAMDIHRNDFAGPGHHFSGRDGNGN